MDHQFYNSQVECISHLIADYQYGESLIVGFWRGSQSAPSEVMQSWNCFLPLSFRSAALVWSLRIRLPRVRSGLCSALGRLLRMWYSRGCSRFGLSQLRGRLRCHCGLTVPLVCLFSCVHLLPMPLEFRLLSNDLLGKGLLPSIKLGHLLLEHSHRLL